MHKLCCVITGPSYQEAQEQIINLQRDVDLLEWRPDLLDRLSKEQVADLRSQIKIPLLLTLKKFSEEWIHILNPEWIDLPWDSAIDLKSKFPHLKTICSYHDFSTTPDLDIIYQMLKSHPADYYKIATMANSSVDVLRMLSFLKANADGSLIGICMGEIGAPSRVLGPIFGNALTYTCYRADSKAAPGQIVLQELLHTYGIKQITKKTAIFGLIGDPVEQSISHQTHNHYFKQHRLDAVYTKFLLKECDLPEFLQLAKSLHFSGLSVTMPLKERLNLYIKTETDLPINTLHFRDGELLGYNTDGAGACLALEKRTQQIKNAIILGAGGAARAIALQLAKKGIRLAIINRTLEKAVKLADEIKGESYSLKEFPLIAEKGYDLLINCTSVGMQANECPIDPAYLLPEKWVMEIITRPKETKLIQAAKEKKCSVIYGEEMFFEQAKKQFEIWFP